MVTRRVVLAAGGAGGLLGAAHLLGHRPAASVIDAVASPPTVDAVAPVLDDDPVAHVVRRFAPAPTIALVDHVRSVGVDAWLGEQLAADSLPQPAALTAALGDLATETSTPDEYLALVRAQKEQERAPQEAATRRAEPRRDGPLPSGVEVALATLLRGVLTATPVRESLVATWADGLHVHLDHDAATQVLTPFLVRDVLRPHATGAFDDLLVAATLSPAMLRYLDGAVSRVGAVNENHARELLELHTVGVDGHDEDDVATVARALTGWTVDPRAGEAIFLPRRQDDGHATVLGWTGSGGRGAAASLLRHLARRPETARRVAHRLAVRFVRDDPDPDFVAHLAEVYLDADTAIAPVVRALADAEAFASAQGRKLRRPTELLTAVLAVLGDGQVTQLPRSSLSRVLQGWQALEHLPQQWPAPNGYPDVAPAWVSSAAAMGRWRLAVTLAEATPRWADDVDAILDALPAALLVPAPTGEARDAIRVAAAQATDPVRAATALVLDLPAVHLR